MNYREFTDHAGGHWQVFEVLPSLQSSVTRLASPFWIADPGVASGALPSRFERGWLAFQRGADRRRLAPIPPGWERGTEAALLRLLDRSEPVPVSRPLPMNPAVAHSKR